MPCSSHKWISIPCNLNSKGYIKIVQNSVFIRKNPGEQMILVPRKLLLLHVCDCNRLRTKIDGLSVQQVPLRLWKSRAWITYFTFWKSTGTNIKQSQQKISTHSLCNVQYLLQPYLPNVYCNAAEYLCLRNIFLRCRTRTWEMQVFAPVQISWVIFSNSLNFTVSIPYCKNGLLFPIFFKKVKMYHKNFRK